MDPTEGKSVAEMTDDELDADSGDTGDAGAAAGDAGAAGADDKAGDAGKTGDEGKDGKQPDAAAGDDDAAAAAAAAAATITDDDDQPYSVEELEALAAENNGMVPLSRLNELVRREADTRRLLDAALQLQTGKQPQQDTTPEPEPEPAPTYDFKAAMREYTKLVTEGDDEAAANKLDEIETKREEITTYRLQKVRDEATTAFEDRLSRRDTAAAIDRATKELYTAFPFLDNASKDKSEVAILAVNAKAKDLIASGMAPHEALRKAGDTIGKQFEKLVAKQPVTTDPPATPDKKPVPNDGSDPRSKAAIARNLQDRQPDTQKSGVGVSERIATINVKDMTDEQLEALEKNEPELFAEMLGNNRVG